MLSVRDRTFDYLVVNHRCMFRAVPAQLWQKLGNSPETPIPPELDRQLNQWSLELTYVNNFQSVVERTTCIVRGQSVTPFRSSMATAIPIDTSIDATEVLIVGGPISPSGKVAAPTTPPNWYEPARTLSRTVAKRCSPCLAVGN